MTAYQILIRLFVLAIALFTVAICYGQSIPCNSPYGHEEMELTMSDTIKSKVIGNQTIHVFSETIDNSSYYVKLPEFAHFDGIYRAYFSTDTNQIAIEVIYKDSVKHGYERRFYKNGQLRVAISYRSGTKDGASISYYNDGAIESELLFQDGKLTYKRRYNRDGQLNYLFENKTRSLWNEKGELFHKTTYKSDSTITVQEWFPNGNPKYSETTINQTIIHEYFYSNGPIKSQEFYIRIVEDDCSRQLIKHGTSKKWKRSGKLKRKQTFSYGIAVGS